MYWILLILRELRRLFNNKTFKMGFTIAILSISIYMLFTFFGFLPNRTFAATRIDVVMSPSTGFIGQNGTSEMSEDNFSSSTGYDGMESTFYNINSGYTQFFFSDLYIPNQNPHYNYINLYYFPVSSKTLYYVGNGYSGSGNVLMFYSSESPREGVGCTYFKNINGAGNYQFVAPGDGFITIAIFGVQNQTIANPFICYYMYDEDVTTTDIETSTNTTTNTIITESQETRNTITDSNVDNTITDLLPEDTFNNPYESNVDSIFTKIYNKFTNDDYTNIQVTIPFTNKSFIINGYRVYGSWDGNWLGATLKSLIAMFWYYIVSRYIILDVLSVIEKIKNGKLDSIETSNVKEDML